MVRCMTLSTLPPMNPEAAPKGTPTNRSSNAARSAMYSETLVPAHTRVHISLPKLSVPNQKSFDGPT